MTISDSSSGVTIYYTTNGTTPTTSSTKYTGRNYGQLDGDAGGDRSSHGLYQQRGGVGYLHHCRGSAGVSPPQGTYTTAQSVAISDTTPGATIYYTTDGTNPTTSSAVYTSSVTVSATEVIKAIAMATGYTTSPENASLYTIAPVLATPTFSPAGGIYTTAQSVSLSDAVSGATIYYTTNGITPTTASTKYTGTPISVSSTQTIKAIAAASGYTNSAVGTAAYTIQAAASSINFSGGFAAGQMVLKGTAQLNGSGLQLTNGGQSQAGTAWYGAPVNVQSFTTDFTFQLTNAAADGITFTVQGQGTAAYGIFGAGLGYEYIPTSVAVKFDLFNNGGEGADSTGLFTNGAMPSVPSIDLSSTGINLHSGDTMAVHMVYNGTTLAMTITDTVTKAVYSTSFAINIPATVGGNVAYVGFTGGTGSLSATQTILTWTYTN